jgi:ATP-dependent protease ClpP protease subunit
MKELVLYGSVGTSFWDEEHFTAADVRSQLAGVTGPVTVRLNSGGGIATEGQAIHAILSAHPGQVDVIIEGAAASAASLIAMAGDTITMSAGSILMIHDPASWYVEGRGTEDDHLHMAKSLGVLATAYARLYARRAGISLSEARAIMKSETYFDGPGAVEAGFATAHLDDGAEVAPAAFDYRLYPRAPEKLRSACGALPRRAAASVLAMMAGAANPNGRKDISMPKTKVTAATAAQPDDETMLDDEDDAPTGTATEIEPDAVEGDDPEDDTPGAEDETDDDAPQASARAIAIINMCARHGVSSADAADYIARGMTTNQVFAAIKADKEGPKVQINGRGPSARITRDEAETRRAGLEGALIARMSRARDVNGPARQFMDLSLAEMAATASGQNGRVRRGADEKRAFEMAFGGHSVSDFPAIFENALNKRLMAAYEVALPTYRAVSTRMDFADFRPHPISQIGNFAPLLPIGENGEIQAGSTDDKAENLQLQPFGRQFRISRQMLVNDDLGAIDRMLVQRGMAIAAWEDSVFWAMVLSGSNADGPTLQETGRQVFNTTEGTKAGTNAAIIPASVALGYKALRERKDVGGTLFLNATPSILVTGPTKEFEAAQLLAPIQAAQASNVNPYVGRLSQVTVPYITGNAWYLFADPAALPVFAYGYLQGEEGPRMRMDEPFGSQGIAYSVEQDFGFGAVDFRGGYKNAGA